MDTEVDPSLAALRRSHQIHWPTGDPVHAEIVLVGDRPDNFLVSDAARFDGVSVYRTSISKFNTTLTGSEWQAAKELARREFRLLRPRLWVARGSVTAEMLGVRALAGMPLYAARTPHGVPVLQGDWQHVLVEVGKILSDYYGKEFSPRG